MPKTIIVSNRLPVKVSRKDGDIQLSPSEGGLATGLGSIYKEGDNVWIGWPGLEITDTQEQQTVCEELKQLSLMPVFLSQDEINQ